MIEVTIKLCNGPIGHAGIQSYITVDEINENSMNNRTLWQIHKFLYKGTLILRRRWWHRINSDFAQIWYILCVSHSYMLCKVWALYGQKVTHQNDSKSQT